MLAINCPRRDSSGTTVVDVVRSRLTGQFQSLLLLTLSCSCLPLEPPTSTSAAVCSHHFNLLQANPLFAPNIGTWMVSVAHVYAHAGQADRAKASYALAAASLAGEFSDAHPHAKLCRALATKPPTSMAEIVAAEKRRREGVSWEVSECN